MGLNGSLATVSIPDLLQLLGTTSKTGVVHVYRCGSWKKLYLRDGQVVVISSSNPDQYVGNTLVAVGAITEADLHQALAVQERDRRLVGLVLVSSGKLSTESLLRRLHEKAFDVLAELLGWSDAMFRFEEYELHRCEHVALDLNVEHLLMEGMRRADEMARLREIVPSDDTLIERTEENENPLLDESMVGFVLDKLDQPRTIGELKRQLKASDFTVLQSVTRLMKQGVLRQARVQSVIPPDRPWLQTARELLSSKNAEQAMIVLRQGLRRDPQNPAARDLLAVAEGEVVTELMAGELPVHAIPCMRQSLEQLTERSLSPTEAFLLSRITGEADIGTLLEAVPLQPAETLLTLRRLVRAGYLDLHDS